MMRLLKSVLFVVLFAYCGNFESQSRPMPLANGLDRNAVADSIPSIVLSTDLDRVLRDYERFWKAGDATELAALFADDGFATKQGRWVRGQDAIKDAYKSAGGDLRLRALAYHIDGSSGWIVGAYGYGDTPNVPDRGKFILALVKSDNGRWQIAADLDSGIPVQ